MMTQNTVIRISYKKCLDSSLCQFSLNSLGQSVKCIIKCSLSIVKYESIMIFQNKASACCLNQVPLTINDIFSDIWLLEVTLKTYLLLVHILFYCSVRFCTMHIKTNKEETVILEVYALVGSILWRKISIKASHLGENHQFALIFSVKLFLSSTNCRNETLLFSQCRFNGEKKTKFSFSNFKESL